MNLKDSSYGKARVRVLRVQRDTARHQVRELSVKVMLEGDFDESFLSNDNSKVIATDTIKNIVNIVARDNPELDSEDFLGMISKYVLAHYPQVATVTVTSLETKWTRMLVDGAEHDHAFTVDANGQPKVRLHATRHKQKLASGVANFIILKSTGSGWTGYVMDENTTLAETEDRIFATAMDAAWKWAGKPESYTQANAKIMAAMLRVFANEYSPSVQNSLYLMGRAALEAVPEIADVTLTCPNRHYLPINMAPFKRDNPNVVFTPTDEPHGQIECKVSREKGVEV